MGSTIIGFTGKRGVGKSEAVSCLEPLGFKRIHTFAPGKAMARAYFKAAGANRDEAEFMVNGHMRDEPSLYLPHNSTPRFFLEQLGFFMGIKMGAEWTLGIELDRELRDNPVAKLAVESVVYEVDFLRKYGGTVIKILRPGHNGPQGHNSDSAVEHINPDYTILNNGTREEFHDNILAVVNRITNA